MKYIMKELSEEGILDKREPLAEVVEGITKHIKQYTEDSDLELLEKLLGACTKMRMDSEASKMYRNIGMHYYYNNSIAKAYKYMEDALAVLNKRRLYDLKVCYLSELGLLYFYDVKYEAAKKVFDKAQELVKYARDLDMETVFYLYYRSGVLHNYLGKYNKALRMFQNAWEYASEDVDKGRVLMNIGVNRKRRGQFREAEVYYTKALAIFEAENAIQECDIYNNLAELYKVMGNYDKALEYIQKAFVSLRSRDMQRYFVYFQTYIEIKTLQGEVSQYLERLIQLLSNVREHFVYKCFIIEGFIAACNCIPEEMEVLKRLQEEITDTIETAACENEDYRNELARCLADVCLSLKLINSDY